MSKTKHIVLQERWAKKDNLPRICADGHGSRQRKEGILIVGLNSLIRVHP
jgi:hypothetical protein